MEDSIGQHKIETELTHKPTLEANTQKAKYKCEYCAQNFTRKDRLDTHLVSHTGKKQFNCTYDGCDKAYGNASHLKRHIKNFHEHKPQINDTICKHPGCLQGFTNSSNMLRHYNQKHLRSRYQCTVCNLSFRQRLQLRKHKKEVHNEGEYSYTCSKCDKGFFNQVSYNRHQSAHRLEQRSCPQCNLSFTKWSEFVQHQRSHKKDQQCTCDLCGKTFSRKPNLKQHMKMHMSEVEVFHCEYENCPKFFSAKRNLMFHVRSKHEGKKFTCLICHSKLSTKQKLQEHLNGHAEGKKKLKRSTISVLMGFQLNSCAKQESSLYSNLPMRRPPISTDSEVSDF